MKSTLKFTALTLLLSVNALAQDAARIYSNGQWIENIQTDSTIEQPLFFGNKFSAKLVADKFVENAKLSLGLNSLSSLSFEKEIQGNELHTIRYKRNYAGLEVIGGETLVHIANDAVQMASTNAANINISPVPNLRSSEANSIALASYAGKATDAENKGLKILFLENEQGESEAKLVYEVKVLDVDGFSSDIHFINAHSGQETLVSSNVQTIKDRKILAASGSNADQQLNLSAFPLVLADKNCASTTSPCTKVPTKVMNAASFAWDNSSAIYDYYKGVHKRDSIDGNGMTIKSAVNFGLKYANAAWVSDKNLMIYGSGDGKEYKDFSVALDVAAHEMTHGITYNTAKLIYSSESGALNESYSDVFGKIVAFRNGKPMDWKLGSELYINGGFIRDMANPEIAHTKNFIHRGESCTRNNDFCGVHDNSGIPNKAAVILAGKIGLSKLERIYYLTLTQLLRPTSTFKDAKTQTKVACQTILGAKSPDCMSIEAAFAAVGI